MTEEEIRETIERQKHAGSNPHVPDLVWRAHVTHGPAEEITIGWFDPRKHCPVCRKYYEEKA